MSFEDIIFIIIALFGMFFCLIKGLVAKHNNLSFMAMAMIFELLFAMYLKL